MENKYMLGDYILFDGIVQEVTVNHFKYLNGIANPNSVQPIPLTESELVKLGFEGGVVEGVASFNDENTDGDTTYYDLRIKRSDVCEPFTMTLVKWGDDEVFTFSYQLLRVRVKTVHHLQHLYFALTQTPLTYIK